MDGPLSNGNPNAQEANILELDRCHRTNSNHPCSIHTQTIFNGGMKSKQHTEIVSMRIEKVQLEEILKCFSSIVSRST